MMKRIIAYLLAFCLVLTAVCAPTGVWQSVALADAAEEKASQDEAAAEAAKAQAAAEAEAAARAAEAAAAQAAAEAAKAQAAAEAEAAARAAEAAAAQAAAEAEAAAAQAAAEAAEAAAAQTAAEAEAAATQAAAQATAEAEAAVQAAATQSAGSGATNNASQQQEVPGKDDAGQAGNTTGQNAQPATQPQAAAPALPTADYGEGPLYVLDNAYKHYGEPAELIPLGVTIVLYHTQPVKITGYQMEELAEVRFALDTEVFTHKEDTFRLSAVGPDGQTEKDVVYLWAVLAQTDGVNDGASAGENAGGDAALPANHADTSENIDTGAQEILEREIQVQATDYDASAPCTPTFALTALPEKDATMLFAVILDDGEPQAIEGDKLTPTVSGSYRFALLDGSGAVLARSAKFKVTLPTETPSAPEASDNSETSGETDGAILPAETTATATDTPEPSDGTDDADAADEIDNTATPGEMGDAETPGDTDTPDPSDEANPSDGENAGTDASEWPEEDETPMNMVLTDTVEIDGAQVQALEQDGAESEQETEIELTVETEGYVGNALSDVTPVFRLSGLPQEEGYRYGASVDGGEMVQLPGDTYTATESGTYALQFSILDQSAAAVATSREYSVQLDFRDSAVSNQAWMTVNGKKVYGNLSDLLSQAASGQTIYILSGKTIVLNGNVTALAGKTLRPDPTVFPDNASSGVAYVVSLSDTSDDAESAGSLFVKVVQKGASPTASLKLTVTAANLVQNAWTNHVPTFTLSVNGDLSASGYGYAVLVNGGTPIRLSQGSYTAKNEGSYTLQFALIDQKGALAQQSKVYSLKLDTTAPLLNVSIGDRYSMKVVAGDTVSGAKYASIDGGKSWSELKQSGAGVSYRDYSASQTMTFKPGTIIVKDQAGNATANTASVKLYTSAASNTSNNSAGTGSSRIQYHSKSTVTTVTAYNGVALVLGENSMSQLMVGEELLDLELYRDSFLVQDEENGGKSAAGILSLGAGNGGGSLVGQGTGNSSTGEVDQADESGEATENVETAENGEASENGETNESGETTESTESTESEPTLPTFTATFTAWSGDESDGVDTLVLTASDALPEAYAYTWEFSGVVYKKLAASGIDYLVLRVGENVTALSTAGFSAGIRYNMYRAEGLASKEFRYTVDMGMPGPTFSMEVTVGGESYVMTADSTSEFYYYDVFMGTAEQLSEGLTGSLEGWGESA